MSLILKKKLIYFTMTRRENSFKPFLLTRCRGLDLDLDLDIDSIDINRENYVDML